MGDTVGIRELKNRLSAVLRRVRRGESVTITDRKKAVAVIVPASSGQDERVIEQLVGAGRLAWSGGKPAGCARPPRTRGMQASEAVRQDRR